MIKSIIKLFKNRAATPPKYTPEYVIQSGEYRGTMLKDANPEFLTFLVTRGHDKYLAVVAKQILGNL